MIRRSAAVAAIAVLLSLFLHALGFSLFGPGLPERKSDNDNANAIELSNSFEDFTEPTSDPIQPEPAEALEPPIEDIIEPEVPISETLVASPDPHPATSPDIGAPIEPQSDAPAEAPIEPDAPTDIATESNPDTPVTPPIEPQADQLAALPPAEIPPAPIVPPETTTVEPEIPNTVEEPSPETPEVGTETSEQAVAVSKRPRLPDERPAPAPQKTLEGFSNFDNLRNPEQTVESPLIRYQREGADAFRTSRGRNQTTGRGVGNSDTTNYAGQVLIHLNQTPVVYVPVRGFAQVFFEINPDGSLAWVDIVDSSGSPEIERAAKDQVIRAAPFPRPPSGSSRKLSFYYQNS